MADPHVESTLSWSFLREEDLPELKDLRDATDYLDDPIERVDLNNLHDLFDAPYADPTRNAVVGRDRNGSVIAYAWGHPRQGEGEARFWLDWAVHPAWRYRGIGEACIVWLRDRGLEWYEEQRAEGLADPLWLGGYVDEKLTLRLRQMEGGGFVAEKWFCDMKVMFDQVNPDVIQTPLPDGVRLAPLSPDLSEKVRRAHNCAFSTVPGANRLGTVVWEHILAITTVRLDWSLVALDDHDRVVGYAVNSGYEPNWESQGYSEGWTEFLGTVPEWRGKGVARALLANSLVLFRDAGLAGAGVGVDLHHGEAAYRLFTDLGYQPAERLVLLGMRP